MMNDLSNAKVGALLFVKRGHYDKGRLFPIDRITPSGRVITEGGKFNPDGVEYGQRDSWQIAYARVATSDDIENINRFNLVKRLRRFSWDTLDFATLKAVDELIKNNKSA